VRVYVHTYLGISIGIDYWALPRRVRRVYLPALFSFFSFLVYLSEMEMCVVNFFFFSFFSFFFFGPVTLVQYVRKRPPPFPLHRLSCWGRKGERGKDGGGVGRLRICKWGSCLYLHTLRDLVRGVHVSLSVFVGDVQSLDHAARAS